MEESKKRKERLKAMRTEAAQSGVNAASQSTGLASHGLSNPLIEIETTVTAPSPRFDYYTHPMSAFSGNKRHNPMSAQAPQRHQFTPQRHSDHDINPPPAHPSPALNCQRPMYQRTNPPLPYHNPAFYSPHQNMMHPSGPHYTQDPVRSPMGPPQRYPPNACSINYIHSPNFARGIYPNSGFGQRISPNTSNYSQGGGRGYSNNNSHYGSGYGYNQHPDSRRGGGRSFGSGRGGRSGGEFYFNKMVEDPWRSLSPVIWKHSETSWMPKSIQSKKAKVTSESPTPMGLAVYLALKLSESATDETAAT